MSQNTKRALASTLLVLFVGLCAGGCGAAAEPPDPNAPTTYQVTADLLAQGREVYLRNCAPCHGPEGKGDGPASATLNPKPRDHSNSEYMDALTDQKLADTIRMGGVISGYPNMPSSPHIKGQDMVSLIAYVRTLGHPVEEITQVVVKVQ